MKLSKFYLIASMIANLIVLLVVFACSAHALEIDLEIIKQIESRGNPLAFNESEGSRGLFQIRPICLKEYNNYHPKAAFSLDDLWNASVSTLIADWYLNERIPQMLRYYKKADTLENRIIAYNAGISYVVNGKEIPKITKKYIDKYKGELKK